MGTVLAQGTSSGTFLSGSAFSSRVIIGNFTVNLNTLLADVVILQR